MKKYFKSSSFLNDKLTNTSVKDKLIILSKSSYLLTQEEVLEVKRLRSLKGSQSNNRDYINKMYEHYIINKLPKPCQNQK